MLPESRSFNVPWRRVERSLGTRLPLAYKVFVEYFGPGRFSEELEYLVPGIENSAYELEYCVRGEHSRSLTSPPIGSLQYVIFPEPNGLLTFGTLPEYMLFWDTSAGDPNAWPIVIPSHNEWLLRYSGNIISFVYDLIVEAPTVDGLEYDPEAASHFIPDDGHCAGSRYPALEAYSRFGPG